MLIKKYKNFSIKLLHLFILIFCFRLAIILLLVIFFLLFNPSKKSEEKMCEEKNLIMFFEKKRNETNFKLQDRIKNLQGIIDASQARNTKAVLEAESDFQKCLQLYEQHKKALKKVLRLQNKILKLHKNNFGQNVPKRSISFKAYKNQNDISYDMFIANPNDEQKSFPLEGGASSEENLRKFYEYMLNYEVELELGKDKKPIANESNRQNIKSVNRILSILRDGEFEIRLCNTGKKINPFLIMDCDLYKITDSIYRQHVFNALNRISIDFDITMVITKNLGVHLYWDTDENLTFLGKRSINRFLSCFLPSVDFLPTGHVVGPSYERRIIRLSKKWLSNLAKNEHKKTFLPSFLWPVAETETKDLMFKKNLFSEEYHFLDKGFRRRNLLKLIKATDIDDLGIKCINYYFARPLKPWAELTEEVLNKRNEITLPSKPSVLDNAELPSFENVAYDEVSNSYLLWNSEKKIWEIKDLEIIYRSFSDQICLDYIYKNSRMIRSAIKSDRNIGSLRKIPNNVFVFNCNNTVIGLEFKNGSIQIIKELENTKNMFFSNVYNLPFEVNLDEIERDLINFNKLGEKESSIVAPEIVKFLTEKFNFRSQTINKEIKKDFLNIIILTILKNNYNFQDSKLQKYLLLYGGGGSGKSSLVNLLKLFTNQNSCFNGEFGDLGGRFETAFLAGKSVISFADENLGFLDKKESKKASILKKLTGGDSIRAEVKFEGVSSFVNKGLIIVTSNNTSLVQNSDYVANKRRTHLLPILNTIRINKQDDSLVEKVMKKDFFNFIFLAIYQSSNYNGIRQEIKNFDIEQLIISEKEHREVENLVDPFLAFLESTVDIDKDNKNNTYISYRHFACLYLQYLVFRRGSSIDLLDKESFIDSIKKYMIDNTFSKEEEGSIFSIFMDLLNKGVISYKKKLPLFEGFVQLLTNEFKSRTTFLSRQIEFIDERRSSRCMKKINKAGEMRVKTTITTGFGGLFLKENYKDYLENLSDYIGIETNELDGQIKKWSLPKKLNENAIKSENTKENNTNFSLKYDIEDDCGFDIIPRFSTLCHVRKYSSKTEKNTGINTNIDFVEDTWVNHFTKHYNFLCEKYKFLKDNSGQNGLQYLEKSNLVSYDKFSSLIEIYATYKDLDQKSKQICLEDLTDEGKSSLNNEIFQLKFNTFPPYLSKLIGQYVIECIYFQNVTENLLKHNDYILHLSPLLQYIFNKLNLNKHWITHFIDYKLILIEKDENLTKKQKTAAIKKLKNYPDKMFIMDMLQTLKKNGFKFTHVRQWDKVSKLTLTYHIFTLPKGDNLAKIFKSFTVLSQKPMILPPIDWKLKDDGRLEGGGYLMSETNDLTVYRSHNPELVCEIKFCEKYKNTLNSLQKMPFIINENLMKIAIIEQVNNYSQELKELFELYNQKKNDEKLAFIFLLKIKYKIDQINNWIHEMAAFNIVYAINPFDESGTMELYFPLHVDRVGRMYNWGVFNIVNSLFFRKLLVENRGSFKKKIFLDATSSMLQIYSMLFGDTKMAIASNLHIEKFDPYMEVRKLWTITQSEFDEVDDWFDVSNDRDFLKKVIMLKLYGAGVRRLQNEVQAIYWEKSYTRMKLGFKKLNKLVIWANRQLELSFPLLFGFADLIKRKTEGNSIKLHWQGNISTYSNYDSKTITLDISSLKEVEDFEVSDTFLAKKDLLTPEYIEYMKTKEYKELSKEKIKKESRKRIKLKWTDHCQVDKKANFRTLITGVIHSLDAEIATELRMRMKSLYKIDVFSIHDCFCVDEAYACLLKKEYKRALIDIVFKRKLCDILVVDDFSNYKILQDSIDKNKDSDIWKNILESYSEFCLKIE